ncbi:acireductone synthase [Actinosynnema sp. NPDC047251]|uniref:Enolase-phosphatase E1 n=1 Tax=Saccharothrix espanaensis (strain ATCC 51144 / DSM 44229 / JCM 9112 / NBRC 15066 / NRRL 15764) TaxID=1179773 RepID=K0JWA3_SACES|nr:acireductone synthase [Saccharothrix espanaensis]CCH28468.1 Enolase-phosphatase E1 [Saccharothrix espanaensis DSM 44229]
MTEWVVLDIEGTLSATDQVLVVLYDYARPRLGPWIDEHGDDPVVAEAVRQIRELSGVDGGTADLVRVLHGWMDADQKVTPLKTLQGLIWQRGYAEGDLVAEFFPDVVPALRKWHEDGVRLAVFSSGSVAGQVAFFGHTRDGDLRGLFEHHFDTVNAGPKREAPSYRAIAAVLGSDDITFYSDVPAELHAAAEAGWRTVGVARPGEPYGDADFSPHRTVSAL